jgi:hypothetical protein
MNIRSFGCSLIFGTDLKDCVSKAGDSQCYSQKTWPALIASNLGLSYRSGAHGGSGNLCILNRVLDSWQPACRDLYIIGWTYIDRFDYSDPNGIHHDISCPSNGNDYLAIRPQGNSKIDRFYYKHLHSEFRDKLTNLLYLKTTIDALAQSNVPFLMTCVDDLLFDQKWHRSPAIVRFQEEIRPHITDFEGMNFVTWSRYHNFEISDNGHPLEQAHAAAADYMLPIIDAILRKA